MIRKKKDPGIGFEISSESTEEKKKKSLKNL